MIIQEYILNPYKVYYSIIPFDIRFFYLGCIRCLAVPQLLSCYI